MPTALGFLYDWLPGLPGQAGIKSSIIRRAELRFEFGLRKIQVREAPTGAEQYKTLSILTSGGLAISNELPAQ
jgi:hypothetical protein